VTLPRATPAPTAAPGPGTTAKYAIPTFVVTVPARTGSTRRRKPAFISSATQSIAIALTADALGINPSTLNGNPAITNISGAACSSGCTVNGPPSPAGSDTFTITTYDGSGATGNALDSNSVTFTIVSGVNNSVAVTLNGIPASLAIGGIPAHVAGAPFTFFFGPVAPGGVIVTVADADGEVISGTYANPVTLTDSDTNGGQGTTLNLSGECPPEVIGHPFGSPTSQILTASSQNAEFCSGGIAENPVTITASAAGAPSASATYAPILNAPVYTVGSGTPASVVVGNPPVVELDATSGTGSTGSATYTEHGWTDDPYDQQLTSAGPIACGLGSGDFFTIGGAYSPAGTVFTITAISAPAVGACTAFIEDQLTLNPTESSAVLNTSYTTSSFSVNRRGSGHHGVP